MSFRRSAFPGNFRKFLEISGGRRSAVGGRLRSAVGLPPPEVRFPWKFPESWFLSRGQISKRMSRNVRQGQRPVCLAQRLSAGGPKLVRTVRRLAAPIERPAASSASSRRRKTTDSPGRVGCASCVLRRSGGEQRIRTSRQLSRRGRVHLIRDSGPHAWFRVAFNSNSGTKAGRLVNSRGPAVFVNACACACDRRAMQE